MAAAVLLKKNANPTDADIDAAITNICRCGVYPRVRDAIQRGGAGDARRGTAFSRPATRDHPRRRGSSGTCLAHKKD